MKNKGNKLKRIILLIIILLVIALLFSIFYVVDLKRVQSDKNTIFCFYHHTYDDGGTVEHIGLGYKIFDYQVTYGRKEVVGGTLFLSYDPKLNTKIANLDKEYVTPDGQVANLDETTKDTASSDYDMVGTISYATEEKAQTEIYVRSSNKYSISNAALIKVNDNTIITKDGKAQEIKDLKAGTKVQIVTEKPLEASTGGAVAVFVKII